jgi:lipopolysaccharide transport system permease protein
MMFSRFGSYILEVWQCRELILVLAKRDLQVQYAQTMLGVLWTLLQPLAAMLIYTFFFSQLVVLPGVDAPYTLFVFTGILIWSNFSTILTQAGTSLMQNQQIIKKIYFPRLVLLLAKVAVSWVEFSIGFCLLLVIAFLGGAAAALDPSFCAAGGGG